MPPIFGLLDHQRCKKRRKRFMTRRLTFMHKFPARNFGSNRDLLISQYCCTYEVNGFVGKWAEQREKYENVVL